MNKRLIVYILGWVLIVEGAAMQIATVTSFIYGEHEGLYFLGVGALSALLGLLAVKVKKPKNPVLYQKAGFAATALSWILMSFVGCFPFWLSGEIPSFIDAFYETVSGFTTTGSTILTDVEALSHGMLMWRSFSPLVGRYGRNRVLACDYPEARRSAEYFPYESREPRSDCGQGCSENEKLRNDALRNLFRLDCA